MKNGVQKIKTDENGVRGKPYPPFIFGLINVNVEARQKTAPEWRPSTPATHAPQVIVLLLLCSFKTGTSFGGKK